MTNATINKNDIITFNNINKIAVTEYKMNRELEKIEFVRMGFIYLNGAMNVRFIKNDGKYNWVRLMNGSNNTEIVYKLSNQTLSLGK